MTEPPLTTDPSSTFSVKDTETIILKMIAINQHTFTTHSDNGVHPPRARTEFNTQILQVEQELLTHSDHMSSPWFLVEFVLKGVYDITKLLSNERPKQIDCER